MDDHPLTKLPWESMSDLRALLSCSLARIQRGFRRRSLTVLMDFTERCNLKCIMCHFSLPGRDQLRQEISIDEFRRFAPQLLPHVSCLGLSCATEPFMHRDFLDALPIVRRYRVPYVYYVTNATMLTERAIIETIRWKVDVVQLSLDSARPGTFEEIRRNANFEKVLANIRKLRDKKVELGSAVPKLQFNVTLMRSNIEELEDVLRLVKELGGEIVDLRHVVPYEGLASAELTLDEHKELTNRQLDKARALARDLGLEVYQCPDNFTLSSDAPRPEAPAEHAAAPQEPALHREMCRLPWSMFVIQPHGAVVPCTNWFTHESMGNIHEQSFSEIWNGPGYTELRRQMSTGSLGANCKICPAMGCGSVDRKESFEVRQV